MEPWSWLPAPTCHPWTTRGSRSSTRPWSQQPRARYRAGGSWEGEATHLAVGVLVGVDGPVGLADHLELHAAVLLLRGPQRLADPVGSAGIQRRVVVDPTEHVLPLLLRADAVRAGAHLQAPVRQERRAALPHQVLDWPDVAAVPLVDLPEEVPDVAVDVEAGAGWNGDARGGPDAELRVIHRDAHGLAGRPLRQGGVPERRAVGTGAGGTSFCSSSDGVGVDHVDERRFGCRCSGGCLLGGSRADGAEEPDRHREGERHCGEHLDGLSDVLNWNHSLSRSCGIDYIGYETEKSRLY